MDGFAKIGAPPTRRFGSHSCKKTSEDFWSAMQRVADRVSADPEWSKGGINLNLRNFEKIYRREIDSGAPVAQASASDKAAK